MKTIQKKLKAIVVAQTVIIVLLVTSLSYVLAQSGSTFTLSQGVYPGAPTYTVWKEGSTYYAKNAYGVIDYSGTNASQIISNSINALTNGGKILVKAGEYIIEQNITDQSKNDITIEGEGYETVFKVKAGANSDVFTISNVSRWQFRNFLIDGQRGQQTGNATGLHLIGVSNFIVENIKVQYTSFTGILVTTSNKGWIVNNILFYTAGIGVRWESYNVVVANNIVLNTERSDGKDAHGINVSSEYGAYGTVNYLVCYRITIANNIVRTASGHGISIDYGTRVSKIIGNEVGVTGASGIEVSWGNAPYPIGYQNIVSSNRVYDTTNHNYFFETQYSVLADNVGVQSNYSGILLRKGKGNMVTGNVIRNSLLAVLEVQGEQDTTISGNTFLNPNYLNTSGNWDTILVKSYSGTESLQLIVSNNRAGGTYARYNIRLEDATDWVVIVGNQLSNYVTGAYNNAGSGTNIVYANNQG